MAEKEQILDAMKKAGEDGGIYYQKYLALRNTCKQKYIGDDGRCKIYISSSPSSGSGGR